MKMQVIKLKHWYYRIVSGNGRIVLTSETYHNRGNALRAAKEFRSKCGAWFCATVPLEVKK